jgi:uncharacterized protein YjiS (DUF1127 family)
MRDDCASIDPPGALPALPRDVTWRDAARAAWQALAARLEARARARRDLHDLTHMTERELRDIGVSLGDIPSAADPHWSRDWPR